MIGPQLEPDSTGPKDSPDEPLEGSNEPELSLRSEIRTEVRNLVEDGLARAREAQKQTEEQLTKEISKLKEAVDTTVFVFNESFRKLSVKDSDESVDSALRISNHSISGPGVMLSTPDSTSSVEKASPTMEPSPEAKASTSSYVEEASKKPLTDGSSMESSPEAEASTASTEGISKEFTNTENDDEEKKSKGGAIKRDAAAPGRPTSGTITKEHRSFRVTTGQWTSVIGSGKEVAGDTSSKTETEAEDSQQS